MAEPVELKPSWEVFSFPVNSPGAVSLLNRCPWGCPRLLLWLQVLQEQQGAAGENGKEFLFSITSIPEKKVIEGEASPCSSLFRWSGLAGGYDILDLRHQARDKQGALSLPGKLWAFVLFQGQSIGAGAKLALASQAWVEKEPNRVKLLLHNPDDLVSCIRFLTFKLVMQFSVQQVKSNRWVAIE